MFACTIQGTPDHPVIKLGGSLTLEHSKEIHAEILSRLAGSSALTLDLGDSEKADLSFIQIIYALLKEQDTRISFSSLPAHLLELAASLGADSLIKDITSRIEEHV